MFRISIYILIQYSKDNLEKLFCQYYSKNCHYFAPENAMFWCSDSNCKWIVRKFWDFKVYLGHLLTICVFYIYYCLCKMDFNLGWKQRKIFFYIDIIYKSKKNSERERDSDRERREITNKIMQFLDGVYPKEVRISPVMVSIEKKGRYSMQRNWALFL